jgi:adenylyltransferase/sulfurtransferase
VPYDTILSSHNAFEVLEPWDVVVDGTDNFPVRYLVNDATQFLASRSSTGRSTSGTARPRSSCPARTRRATAACSRSRRRRDRPELRGGRGVRRAARIVGSIQATEAVKLITGKGDPLIGRLLIFDALEMDFQTVRVRWDADCPVCGKEPRSPS